MDFGDSNAIYLQIADQLSENILLRRWNPGDRIPSVRELAVSIEVNPNTVMRTFNYLQDKGIITIKEASDILCPMTDSKKQKHFERKTL